MNLLLGIGEWFAQNWFILLIIVLMIAMLVPSYIRQKKEINAKNELFDKLKKGTRVITTAGVYGVVESIELTTDGKVVTILTGSAKNPTTMTIHINAIGGIDNKTPVVEDMNGNVVDSKAETKAVEEKVEEPKEDVKVEAPKAEEKPATAKKTTTKKTTTKKTTK